MTPAGVLLHMRIKTIFSHVMAAFASSTDFIHLLFQIPSCFFLNSCIYQLFYIFADFHGSFLLVQVMERTIKMQHP